jgi:hypothetical protein
MIFGNYIGPVIVKLSKDKGRGLYLTSDVEPMGLILAEKAFSCAFYDDECELRGISSSAASNPPSNTDMNRYIHDLDKSIFFKKKLTYYLIFYLSFVFCN